MSSACSVLKTDVVTEPQTQRHTKRITHKKFVKTFNSIYPDYHYLLAKAKIKFKENNTTHSLRGIFRVVKDSMMIISLYHSTGIPVAKLKLTKDTIYLIDELNHNFYKKTYKWISDKYALNLTYSNIEALLFARPFIYDDTVFSFKKFKDFKRKKDSADVIFYSVKNNKIKRYYKKNKKGKKISVRLRQSLIGQKFYVNANTYFLDRSIIEDFVNNYKLDVFYINYGNTLGNKPFVKKMKIILNNKNNSYNFDIKYYKVVKKDRLKLKFKIPK